MTKKNSISNEKFYEVYVPAAKEGRSALEIGNMLGIEGDEKKVAQFVTVKAAQLRKQLKDNILQRASEKGLSKEKTDEAVSQVATKIPKLKTRGRHKKELSEQLKNDIEDILSACDE